MRFTKRLVIALIVALCGIGAANAQVRFGLKAGVNVNSFHLNNPVQSITKDNSCGYTLGLMTEFQVPIVGLCFDVSAMYTRMNSDVDVTDAKTDFGKNFLEIPVNIKYKFQFPVISRVFTPYLFTGPSFAMKLDKAPKDASVYTNKGWQTAWNVGLGFELVHHLQLGASYGIGINNIAKHWVNTSNTKAKNNYWTVTAAYLF